MPTEEDIIRARALSELAEAVTRRDTRKAEAANARLTALSEIPAVGAAVAAHDEAMPGGRDRPCRHARRDHAGEGRSRDRGTHEAER